VGSAQRGGWALRSGYSCSDGSHCRGCGALPETVDADSGRFFETDDDFANALHAVAELTPQRCRDSAAARFPIRRTALAYLDLYSRILDGETLS